MPNPTLSQRFASLQGGQRRSVVAPDGAAARLAERLANIQGARKPFDAASETSAKLAERLSGIQGERKPFDAAIETPAKLAGRLAVGADGLLDGSAPKVAVHTEVPPPKLSEPLRVTLQMPDTADTPIPSQPVTLRPLRDRLEETLRDMAPFEEPSTPFAAFGEWLPDLPDFANPGALEALNVIPLKSSYGPQKDLSAYSNSLSATCQGAFGMLDKDGNTNNFAGDGTHLYRAASTDTFSDVSIATDYTTGEAETWEFTRFDERVIATNFAEDPQSLVVGTSSLFAVLTTAFKARHVAQIREFVVFGNTSDAGDGAVPQRIRWSAAGDPTDYTVAAATQSDFRDLSGDGGWIQSIVGGEYGIVFAERSIWRMTYAAPPVVFQLDEVLPGHGTPAPNSPVVHGRNAFYLDNDGFKVVIDGSGVEEIGNNKVDRFFYADANPELFHRIYGAVDPLNNLYYCAYPSNASSGNPDSLIIYDWINRRWSHANIDCEILYRTLAAGFTLDGLDAVSASIDTLTPSLDSRAWTGSSRVLLSAFDTSHRLNFFDGATLEATIDTTEIEPNPGKRFKIRAVRPLVDGGSPTVQIGSRERLQDAVSFGPVPGASVQASGKAALIENGRYMRARVKIPAGDVWTHAQGVHLIGRDDGQQ